MDIYGINYFEGEKAESFIKMVESGQHSLIVFQNNDEVSYYDERGIKTLLFLLEINPGTLKNAVVFDKVIGKAAACLLVLAGVKSAYGSIMSEAGHDFLSFCGLPHAFGSKVERILNRTGDDYCPVEKACLDAAQPLEGYNLIKKKLSILKAN